jgi:hypothetical protein
LRAGMLSAVYHGETSALEVQQMARSYTQLTEEPGSFPPDASKLSTECVGGREQSVAGEFQAGN